MSYFADPGGVFASDAHRRVLGHLPLPDDDATSIEALSERIAPDEHSPTEESELEEIVRDLEADGHAADLKDGWKQTKKGLDALNAPVQEG